MASGRVIVRRTGGRLAASRKLIDHLPEGDRFALRDEINLARDMRPGLEPIGGQEVGGRGVVDVDGVDLGVAPADATKPPALRAEMILGRRLLSPGPQIRCGRIDIVARLLTVRPDDELFRDGLRLGVSGVEPIRIRSRLVGSLHRLTVEHHAGRAGEDDAPRTDERQDAITFRVPCTFTRSYSCSGPHSPALAAVWKTVWQLRTARSTVAASEMSPSICSTPSL